MQITTNGTIRTIPDDEPVFLIRGQDAVGGAAVRAWADLAAAAGSDPEILRSALDHADKMDAWPKKKVADLPASTTFCGFPVADDGAVQGTLPDDAVAAEHSGHLKAAGYDGPPATMFTARGWMRTPTRKPPPAGGRPRLAATAGRWPGRRRTKTAGTPCGGARRRTSGWRGWPPWCWAWGSSAPAARWSRITPASAWASPTSRREGEGWSP